MDMKGKPRSRGVLQEEEKDGAEVSHYEERKALF